ncbi:MAG: hypothetical protein IJ730_06525, partial [Alphaproteobacteria bacterium]|nr:hypothetical protein [Alphaproteobacteria bacterium]
MQFIDTDDYMRVVRLRDFFENPDIGNNIIKRCDFPYGCNLHWTRFYDFFLIIPSYILSFFTSSIESAIDYVCFFIGPILRIVTAFVLLKLTHKFMDRDNAFLCLVLFAVSPIIAVNGNFGRPDHHSFIILFMVLFLSKIISAIENNFQKNWLSVGRFSAACIWISPETLIPLLIVDSILFLYALRQNHETQKRIFYFLYLKSTEIALDISFIILPFCSKNDSIELLIAVAFLMYLLHNIRKNTDLIKNTQLIKISRFMFFAFMLILCCLPIKPIYYDEISIVHFALYICSSIVFSLFITNQKLKLSRLIFSILITVTVFLFCYPKFIFGMGADISDYVKNIWLCKVGEMQSPFQTEDGVFFILHAIFIILAVINKSREIFVGKYANKRTELLFWITMVVLSLTYLLFAGFANRMLVYSSLFSLPLLVDFGMNSIYTLNFHRLVRILITFFITVLFMFCSASTDEDDDEDNPEKCGYTSRELFTEIDKISDTPVVIMASSNDGPSILYYTKHCIVGAPYHRQEKGIISSYKVMEADYNEKDVKNILSKTDSSYIFIRKSAYSCMDDRCSKTLPGMIIAGKYPSWITLEKLPKKFSDNVILAK